MEIKDVRKKNLVLLITRQGGNQAEFARAVGVAVGYVSQILNDWQGRGMGGSVARRIERKVGKPKGWMDSPHPEEWREDQLMGSSSPRASRGKATNSQRAVWLASELETLSETSLDAVANLIESLKRIEGPHKGPPPGGSPPLNIRK